MSAKYRFFIIVFTVLYLSGCGYTAGSLLPNHLRTIYVEDFGNKIDPSSEPSGKHGFRIYRAGVETDITEAIVSQFIFDGHLHIVDKDDADLVLRGGLLDYYKQPLRYDRFDNVEEYRVIITVDMELVDVARDSELWKEKDFIGYDTYRLTGAFASGEEEAREGAIKDLAKKIVEKVIEAW
ncbi:LPS assembly lipoprotein LptE [Omnitrophica bacterium]|nr:LPS assembly lipoprotein LptE [Candidatus Omnitrophota bacterium]